ENDAEALRELDAQYRKPAPEVSAAASEEEPPVPRLAVKPGLVVRTECAAGRTSAEFDRWVTERVRPFMATKTEVVVMPLPDVAKRDLTAVPSGVAIAFVDRPGWPVPVDTRLLHHNRMFFGRYVVEVPHPASCGRATQSFYKALNELGPARKAVQQAAAVPELELPWSSVGVYSLLHPNQNFSVRYFVVVSAGVPDAAQQFFGRCCEARESGTTWFDLLFATGDARGWLRSLEERATNFRKAVAAKVCAALGCPDIAGFFQFDCPLYSIAPLGSRHVVLYNGCQCVRDAPAALFALAPLRGFLYLRQTDGKPWSASKTYKYAFPSALPYQGRVQDIDVPVDTADPHVGITTARGASLFAAKFQAPAMPYGPDVRHVLDDYGWSCEEPDQYLQPVVLAMSDTAEAPDSVFWTLL
ncbi:MAG TPA: hypothetical protein VKD22_12260, partial [Ramlibacter sp.]|nr:hypothetical protein [Ramlibacter sp.]